MSTMYSKVKIAGHPVHPMLVVFPVTFYTTALVAFVTYAATDNLFWWRLGLWANVAGVITALVAAIPGFIDWAIGIPRNTRAKATGRNHMLLNLSSLSLFAINLIVQRDQWVWTRDVVTATATGADTVVHPDPSAALVLSGLGFLMTMIAGFLGWALVQTHHVGVNLNEEQKRYEPHAAEPPHGREPPHSRPITQS